MRGARPRGPRSMVPAVRLRAKSWCHTGARRPQPSLPREPLATASATVDEQQGTVVLARAEGLDQSSRAALEVATQQPLGLAQHAVDPEHDVAVRRLDHAVGVE